VVEVLPVHPYEDGMAEEWIASLRPAYEAGKTLTWAVVLREEGELVGAITLHPNARDGNDELCYWIGRPYWGRGYATEVAREVARYGFEGLGFTASTRSTSRETRPPGG
jgi:[ribosomal protein S5]-alanine N-acetyltransferase